jgi:UDP-glucose 4-epimerase
MLRPMTIFGGAGFLARSLMAVAPDWQITTFDRAPWTGDISHHRHIVGDVLDRAAVRSAVEGAELVFLRQGVLGGPASIAVEQCRKFLAVNAESVLSILSACDEAKCRRVIFDSSEQVFGQSGDLSAFSARAEPSPMNFYGASKVVAEKALGMWAMAKPDRSAQIFRYSRVRSPATPDVIHHFVKACIDNSAIRIKTNPDRRISFVHIDDVVAANRVALTRTPRMAIYNVSCDRPISVLDLAHRANDLVQSHVPIEFESQPGAGFEPHVTGMEWESSAEELGLMPRYGINDMIAQTIAVLRPSVRPSRSAP